MWDVRLSMHAPQVLVVDEYLEIRTLLACYMPGQGLHVQLAAKCAEAHERIAPTRSISLSLMFRSLMDPCSTFVAICGPCD